jgi:CHAT domain-containing protein/Tfp pilus assembly protein PilF
MTRIFILTLILLSTPVFSKDNSAQEAEQLLQRAEAHLGKSEYQEALNNYSEALKVFEKIKLNKGIADSSYGLGKVYEKLTEYEKGVTALRTAVSLHEQLGDYKAVGLDLNQLATIEMRRANYAEVQSLVDKAIKIHDRVDNKTGLSEAYRILGRKFLNTGNAPKALELGQQAISLAEQTKDRKGMALTLNMLGIAHVALGNYSQALNSYERALTIVEQLGDKEATAQSLANLAQIHHRQGNYDQALEEYRKSLAITREIKHKYGIAINLTGFALTRWRQGHYSEVLDKMEEAQKIWEESGDRQNLSLALMNLGAIYGDIGNDDLALQHYLRSVELLKETGEKNYLWRSLNSVGQVYARRKQYETALNYYSQSLKLAEETGNKQGICINHNYLGKMKEQMQNYQAALVDYKKTLEIAEQMGDKPMQGRALLDLGSVHYAMGMQDQAAKDLAEAIRISQEMGHQEILIDSFHLQGLVYSKLGQKEKGRKSMENAISVIEGSRKELELPEEKASFLEKKLTVYEDLIQLLVQMERHSEALQFAERSKARAFLDLLSEAKIHPEKDLKPELKKNKLLLQAKHVEIQKKLRFEHEKDKIDPITIGNLEGELLQIEKQYLQLKREIRKQNPNYSALADPQPIGINDVRKLLDKTTALLEYSVGESNSYLFLVTSSNLKVITLPGEKELSGQIEKLREVIQKPDQLLQELESTHTSYMDISSRLYDILIKPVHLELVDKKMLLIVPDGTLNYLPFEVLLTNKPQTHKIDFAKLPYLIRKFQMHYAPSVSVLTAIDTNLSLRKARNSKDLLATADPIYGSQPGGTRGGNQDIYGIIKTASSLPSLPNTRLEVQQIAELYPKEKVTLLIGKEANEKNIKQTELRDYRLLHFAAHGIINEDQSEFSSLVLTMDEDGQEDGFLMMREVFDLKLNADLVTLSACRTALGQRIRGEGINSLARAFLYAGTNSVLVSLWDVSDKSTAALMKRIYANVSENDANKAVALTKAKLKMIEDGTYSHPYYWAPFVLIGRS